MNEYIKIQECPICGYLFPNTVLRSLSEKCPWGQVCKECEEFIWEVTDEDEVFV